MAMLLLKNHHWATFQQQFQYSLNIKTFCNIYTLDTTAMLRVYRSEQTKKQQIIFYIPTHNWNLKIFQHCRHCSYNKHTA